ncbi:MAG TPA: HEAT repeat domain-containing protein [Anaeromyxobacteraceae bacterium]|nr:HEAT repeat domain-containing protein [Anaeromyxobacteraceae bacterium]
MGTGEAQQPAAWTRLLAPARLLLYALLVSSALATLLAGPSLEQAVREGRLPQGALVVAPALLLVFILVFAAYRYALVRSGHYLAGKAFVQVGLMLLVLTLLLPGSLERYRAAGTVRPVDLSRHLSAPDAETRAMAAELTRHRERGEAMRYLPRLLDLLDDPSPEVRRQAHASLVALAGRDAGGEGAGAAARWRAFWRGQGTAIP